MAVSLVRQFEQYKLQLEQEHWEWQWHVAAVNGTIGSIAHGYRPTHQQAFRDGPNDDRAGK